MTGLGYKAARWRGVAGALLLLGPVAAAGQDTVVVRADNPSIWGSSPRLVEQVRIGTIDGDPATAFGRVTGVVVDDAEVIWVADGLAAEVRRFAPDGGFLGVVGRKGEGPGEFQGISGIKRLPDGRVVVWDARGGRFSFFAPDGSFLDSARRQVGILAGPPEVFQADTAGFLYHMWLWPRPPSDPGPARGVWYKLSQDGTVVDSLAIPPTGRKVIGGRRYPFGRMEPFSPVTMTALSPHGYLVEGNNESYSLFRPLSDGRVLAIRRDWTPIRVRRGERVQYADHAAHTATLWGPAYGFTSDIPTEKPPFWAMRVDEEGRLWIARHAEGIHIDETPGEQARRTELAEVRGSEPPPLEWWEPLITDVIEPTGRYVGTLRFPSNQAAVVAARGHSVWVVEEGAYDEQYVVRYRIDPSGR